MARSESREYSGGVGWQSRESGREGGLELVEKGAISLIDRLRAWQYSCCDPYLNVHDPAINPAVTISLSHDVDILHRGGLEVPA